MHNVSTNLFNENNKYYFTYNYFRERKEKFVRLNI